MSDIETLFEDHADDVYHFLVYYTRRDDVEDLVQETFIRALRSIDGFEGRSAAKTWLITIARRLTVDGGRKKRDVPVGDEHLEYRQNETGTDASEAVIRQETADELLDQIHRLPDRQRDVMLLRGISELDATETAAVLNMSRTGVYVTYHRALRTLRSRMDRGGDRL
ncbi:RNA polymerase sigma factor [Salisediminibacterium selenitireducens]|uniref:RNA polymerase sigma factor n=1 Tax=Bacillus selenitireducens (strain ATCC 700615 / DSM 15326 / MLS10) TaxID=439292 RepID=D6XWL7_BACIE|nr:RNA polymerase sigma factor [Salisediminibacterium selenitireducens]ADH97859.1 RNA polymerase, sigma-24 subunit, ECF subfamily [[Bacillus] selenitireducens MLS10]